MSICQIYDLCADTLWLGRYGENGARDIAIDVGRWFADLGTEGTVVLVNWRPGEDDTPYNPNVTMDGSKVVWSPNNIDLAISGRGFAELRYYVGNALAKSKTFRTVIDRTPSEGANPPSAAEDWVERMEDAAVTAQTASETAVSAAETAAEGAQAVAQALPTVTQAAQTATSAATTATNAATEAAASEEVASAAANAAQTASETATAASQTAVSSASTATTKAAQAVEAASTATAKASEATQAATTATANAQTSTAKAGEATTAAATATSKATEATTAASTASTAATTATGAASTATSAASTATAAKTAAQTAQGAAETAQTAAESAAASVSASAAQIATNTADITALKTDLLHKANIDGAYSDLTAGNAEQLVSTVYEEDSVPYIFRTAGGSMDIGDREEDMLVGGSVAWNQLVPAEYRDFTSESSDTRALYFVLRKSASPYTTAYQEQNVGTGWLSSVVNSTFDGYAEMIHSGAVRNIRITPNNVYSFATGHKYLFALNIISADTSTVGGLVTNDIQVIDLTQMFGSTIADYIYRLEQATAGAGVAWFRKLFPADYYPYDAGTLKSVEGVSAHATTGFNQWDEVTELGAINHTTGEDTDSTTALRSKNYTDIVGGSVYCFRQSTNSIDFHVHWYDANKNFISYEEVYTGSSINYKTTTAPNNARYMRFNLPNGYGTTYKNDICINLSWDGERDGEYEPYVKRSYPLDSSLTLRGIPKLDSANNLYYDGDTYESDGTVTRRYGVLVIDGVNETFTGQWGATNNGYAVYKSLPSWKSSRSIANAISNQFIFNGNGYASMPAMTFVGGSGAAATMTFVLPATVTKLAEANAWASQNPIIVIYELNTPTTETADPYQNPQIVDDFGTEEYVTTSIVPVGHVTKYQPNLRAKLEMSPDSPDGDGDYIVRQANGENSYITLASTATIQDILARLTALEGNTT